MQRSYPVMLGANRIVFDSETPDYEELSHIMVSENSTNNGPFPNEGEQKLIFRGTVTVNDTDVTVNLTSGALLLSGNDVGIRCKAAKKTYLVRAKQLQNHLLKMMSLVTTRPVFSPEVRPAGGSEESDSGDEDVPVDQAIPSRCQLRFGRISHVPKKAHSPMSLENGVYIFLATSSDVPRALPGRSNPLL